MWSSCLLERGLIHECFWHDLMRHMRLDVSRPDPHKSFREGEDRRSPKRYGDGMMDLNLSIRALRHDVGEYPDLFSFPKKTFTGE